MKKSLYIFLAVLFLITSRLNAEDRFFTESGEIVEGEEWGQVFIYGVDTIVNMSGGTSDFTHVFDSSTFNITGGSTQVRGYDNSTTNVSGGNISVIEAWNNSEIFYSNGASANSVLISDSSFLIMDGGFVDYIGVGTSGTSNINDGLINSIGIDSYAEINLFQCDISDNISAKDFSWVNIYGKNLEKFNVGGTYGYGYVTGTWNSGATFNIDFGHTETFSRVVLVPEPSCLMLFGIGLLLIRKK